MLSDTNVVFFERLFSLMFMFVHLLIMPQFCFCVTCSSQVFFFGFRFKVAFFFIFEASLAEGAKKICICSSIVCLVL